MNESGRPARSTKAVNYAGSQKNVNGKKRTPTPYIGDPQLFRRVDKYLDEKADQDVIDKEAMVEDLRTQYKEYGRRNKTAFRNAVFKAFDIVMLASMQNTGNASDCEVSSDDSDLLDDDGEDSTPFSDDGPMSRLDSLNSESRKNSHPGPYIQVLKKMTNSGTTINPSQELINISSSDDEASNETRGVIDSSSKKEMPMPRLGLPIGTKLLTASIPPRDTVTIIRKRKPVDIVPAIQLVKRQKLESSSVPKTKLKDFGGNLEIVKSICQLLLHMKHPEVYRKLGVSPPRGFLLHGPPGSGKTLLAHAIAGELGVPLIKVAATEMVSGISGDSELRIRELFEQAKNQAPCVLFIDEVDSITPRRDVAHKDMERRIVAQLLSSLDELSEKPECDQVLVIGATNRPDSLDPAMRRAGRFDREVCLGIPDMATRTSILKVLCTNMRLNSDLSFERIASLTPGYVGADLKALASEAAIAAVNRVLSGPRLKQIEQCEAVIDENSNPEKIGEVETSNKNLPSSNDNVDGDIPVKEQSQDQVSPSSEQPKGDKEDSEKSQEKNDEKMEEEKDIEEDKEKKEEEGTKVPSEFQVISMEIVDDSPKINKDSVENLDNSVVELNNTNELIPSNDCAITKEKPESILHAECPLTENQLENLYIEEKDFLLALKVVQPSAKREGFATVPDVTWNDIGSLQDIRDQLQMSIMMPVQYPKEFEKLAISSPAGILLCGPPGCGKTLLAKAVANEANINFISVKGPELLNMYVGESERAVRQCFQRARNSQPCVIFFDELDALCPKRSDSIEGSASSRVVNQLLTEMDGVEGRSGVFLMAATNRPDMVDPAVMRPGRFDKVLYVGLPNAQDRIDILKAITKNGTKPLLDVDVDLEAIGNSEECEGYTGADLAALIKEASVLALSEFIANERKNELGVKHEHIQKALRKIRPSVSEKDHKRYESLRLQYTSLKGIHG